MSRNHSHPNDAHRERPADPRRSVLIPITELPHLADAAKRSGQTDRLIRVELPEPVQINTPNRAPGQWLASGKHLPDPFSPEREQDEPWKGFDR